MTKPFPLNFFSILLLLVFWANTPLFAQKEYTDHKPVYRKWQDNYILDKIEYTKDETVFYFRFVCRSGQGISAIFYPIDGEYPWYLKANNLIGDELTTRSYNLKKVKNIRRNSELLTQELTTTMDYRSSLDSFGYTVFSCEIHFDRLPNEIKSVDLIEGEGYEFSQNHFNCFDVKLKTWDDETLGQISDSKENVRSFERKFNISNSRPNRPKPKPKVAPNTTTQNPIAQANPTPNKNPKPKPKVKIKPKETPKPAPIKRKIPAHEEPGGIARVRYAEDVVCNKPLVLDGLEFQDGTTDFKGMVKCKQVLHYVFDFMEKNPNSKLTVIGHTDIFGDKDRMKELSKKRAYKVQRWLSMMGISPWRIEIEYYGLEKPLLPKGSPLNRRVEIKLSCN